MRFFESLSREGDSVAAVEEICAEAGRVYSSTAPDLGFLFFSPHHAERGREILGKVVERTGVRHLLGCTGESIIGGGQEVERAPAVSLWLAELPGVEVRPFRVSCEQTPDGHCFPVEPPGLFLDPGDNAAVILLGEPFTMPVDVFLKRFDEDYPGIPVVGGMASGASSPGRNLLLGGGEVMPGGAVGVLISGPVRVRAVVSQGCRPIGRRYVVTECDRNAILKMGGKTAVQCVQEMFGEISSEERELFQSAPHVGVVLNEGQREFGPGDFLIRNVLGVDAARGALFLSDCLRRGQTVQFHLRDGRAASEDLEALLAKEVEACCGDGRAGGGLVFSCNGRGTRLFSRPDHDISAIREILGEIPVSGFFAQGELGPVGKRNHLHGFTACVALFCSP